MKIRLWKLGHSSLQVWKSGAKRGSDELTNLWNSHALCASFIFSIKYNYYILLSYFNIANLLNSHALCAKSAKIFSLLLFIQRCRRRKKYSETRDIFIIFPIHSVQTLWKYFLFLCPSRRRRKKFWDNKNIHIISQTLCANWEKISLSIHRRRRRKKGDKK